MNVERNWRKHEQDEKRLINEWSVKNFQWAGGA